MASWLRRDAVVSQGLVEAYLEVGLLAPPADDEAGRDLELTRGEPPWAAAWDHDRSGRHDASVLLRLGAGDIDERRGSGQHDVGAEPGTLTNHDPLRHDAAGCDEGVVLDDHR